MCYLLSSSEPGEAAPTLTYMQVSRDPSNLPRDCCCVCVGGVAVMGAQASFVALHCLQDSSCCHGWTAVTKSESGSKVRQQKGLSDPVFLGSRCFISVKMNE